MMRLLASEAGGRGRGRKGSIVAKKVLIVDDSKVMRSIIKQCLDQAGHGKHTVLEAGTGEEALKLIQSQKPDLVLTDLYMPGMTGMDLLQEARSRGIRVRIGFITSETHPALHQSALNEGAIFVITKPPTGPSLKKA